MQVNAVSSEKRATDTPNEPPLLKRFVEQADQEAFRTVVDMYAGLVLGACGRILGAEQGLAEDAAQAVFIILARKAGGLRDRRSLGGWLYRTACFVAADMRRTHSRREQSEATTIRATEPSVTTSIGDELANWPVAREQLDAAIRRLPARQQDVIVVHYFQGRTLLEVASHLHCPVEIVRTRVNRARAKIRRRLLRKGIAISLVALIRGLETEAAGTAAKAVADQCFAAAVQSTTGAAAAIAEHALTRMFWWSVAKYTGVAIAGLAATAAITTGAVALHRVTAAHSARSAAPKQAEVPAAPAPIPGGTVPTAPAAPQPAPATPDRPLAGAQPRAPLRGRADPAFLREFPLADELATARDLAYDGHVLWVATMSTYDRKPKAGSGIVTLPVLHKLDPATGALLGTLKVQADFSVSMWDIAPDGNRIWITDWKNRRIHAVDAGTGQLIMSIDSPGEPGVPEGSAPENAGAPRPPDRAEHRAPAAMHTEQTGSIGTPVNRPAGIDLGDGSLWVLDMQTVYRVNPRDGSIMASLRTPANLPAPNIRGIAYDRGDLWLISGSGK